MTLNKPQITAIRPNGQDPAKRDLFVDGEFYITLPFELVLQQELHEGDPFGEEELDALTLAVKLIPAKEKAYQYLGYGDLSRKALFEKLTRFGIEPQVAEAACDKMEEQGFLDDDRLAARLAEKYARSKRWGPRRILPEMIRKGIPSDLAREAVDALDADYTDSVRYYMETKYHGYDLTDRKILQKVSQGLQRLGFDFDDIRSVINEYDD
ncbi:MAG: regulatory protein RecX [Clostridia bacterium]|nr:regulatory protein RecX [Clostridia bacterium]